MRELKKNVKYEKTKGPKKICRNFFLALWSPSEILFLLSLQFVWVGTMLVICDQLMIEVR